jgi:hypothetical protein
MFKELVNYSKLYYFYSIEYTPSSIRMGILKRHLLCYEHSWERERKKERRKKERKKEREREIERDIS